MAKAKTPKTKTTKKSSKKPETISRSVSAVVVDDDHPDTTRVHTDTDHDGSTQSYNRDTDQDPIDDTDFIDSAADLPVLATSTSKSSNALTSADPVALYLSEVRKYPLLSREQEQELAKKYFETKDPAAAQALVTANLRFVVKVAAEYSRFGARMIDLIQEGNVGLMHAVRDFNPYKGVRLITYAVWWIRGYIQEYLMKQYSMVKIGTTQNQKRLFYQLQKEKAALDAMGKNPDIKLIAEKMGIPADEVMEMSQRMSGRDVSLDAPLDDDSPVSLKDLQRVSNDSPESALEKEEQLSILREKIDELKGDLNPKEIFILEERLLADEPLTLQEIGDKFKTTREAVRQMEVRVMKKIKDKLEQLS